VDTLFRQRPICLVSCGDQWLRPVSSGRHGWGMGSPVAWLLRMLIAVQNQMNEALMLFESIVNSRWFTKSAMILFLNKMDLFREKLPRRPITDHGLPWCPRRLQGREQLLPRQVSSSKPKPRQGDLRTLYERDGYEPDKNYDGLSTGHDHTAELEASHALILRSILARAKLRRMMGNTEHAMARRHRLDEASSRSSLTAE